MNPQFLHFLDQLSAVTKSPLVEGVKKAYILCENQVELEDIPSDVNAAKAIGEEVGKSHVEQTDGAEAIEEGVASNLALGATTAAMVGCAGAPQFTHIDLANQESPTETIQELRQTYDIPEEGVTDQNIIELADSCIGQISAEMNSQKGTSDDDFNPSHTAGWSQALAIYDLLRTGKIPSNDPHWSQEKLADHFAAKMDRLHNRFLDTPFFLDSYKDEKSRTSLNTDTNGPQDSTYTVNPDTFQGEYDGNNG